MFVDEQIEITWQNTNRFHYISKGYKFTKTGEKLSVKIDDLPISSNVRIKIKCDYQKDGCKDVYTKRYADYIKNNKNSNIHSDCCNNPKCVQIKRENSFNKTYGYSNAMQIPNVQEKIRNTFNAKYGGNSPMCNDEVKQKSKDTIRYKYGVNSISDVEEVKIKMKNTLIKNYGVENPMQSQIVKDKYKATCLEKYGVEYYTQTEEFSKNCKETCMERYGVEYFLQQDHIQKSARDACLEKYGVENCMSLPFIREKSRQTLYLNNSAPKSKQQEYLSELYNGKLNYLQGSCFLDIAFIEDKIYIEYQGSGHELSIKFGKYTEEEFKLKEINRGYFLTKIGWKQIEIVSRKDKLPSDSSLLQILSYAKEYISTGHTWIKFDIDNSTVICSKYTLPYDYGELRKITKSNIA